MRILMVAPQPFFAARGAPLCVYQHIKALIALNYEIDLVTYPFGKDIELPGLKLYRTPGIPFIRSIKPGFSFAKFPLNALILLTVLWRLWVGRYRYLYTHEEAALIGVLLAPLFACKHLYYMHCDLSQLVPSYLRRLMYTLQTYIVRKTDTIIAFYPEVTSTARKMAPAQYIHTLLPLSIVDGLPPADEEDVAYLRDLWKLGSGPVLLYTGTLEAYQGIELLLQSVCTVHTSFPEARYVIVGGNNIQVKRLEKLAGELGIMDAIRFTGQLPLEDMPRYMSLADIVLSPRCEGTHVPLKIYTYLHSGKAILATDILSHTQILTPEMALLVPPTCEGLAQGTLSLLRNPERARELGRCSQNFAREHYNWSVFLEKSRQIYDAFISMAH